MIKDTVLANVMKIRMKNTPVTGQECIDFGWSNDSMGELFEPQTMYCAVENEGKNDLTIIKLSESKIER